MKNIFDLVDDAGALDAFISGKPQTKPGGGTAIRNLEPFDDKLAEYIEKIKNEMVIGQDAIVSDCLAMINRRIAMQRVGKPICVHMFVGATGAGKTELAKAIATTCFNGRLLRFDCNEMTDKSSAVRLIGSPPGYIGSEDGGQLTRGISLNGSGVILFDEIEKAHEDVYKLIMGLMDEGRITEQSTGKVADATAHVIILTSNAAHQKIAQIVRDVEDVQDRRTQIKDAMGDIFRPEQLARIDEVYAFAPLDRLSLARIVFKMLLDLARDAGVEIVKVDTSLIIDTVVMHERMASYGIRELWRVVEKTIIDEIYLRRKEGCKQVTVKVVNGNISVVGIDNFQSLATGV